MKKFEELNESQLEYINGGLLLGAIVGAIFGGVAGLVVACGTIVANGSTSGNTIWKCYTAGALAGAAIGAYTPF